MHVRGVPEPVLAALRERAARNGRSVQEEVRRILLAAAAERPEATPVEPITLVKVRTSATTTWSREEIYGSTGR